MLSFYARNRSIDQRTKIVRRLSRGTRELRLRSLQQIKGQYGMPLQVVEFLKCPMQLFVTAPPRGMKHQSPMNRWPLRISLLSVDLRDL